MKRLAKFIFNLLSFDSNFSRNIPSSFKPLIEMIWFLEPFVLLIKHMHTKTIANNFIENLSMSICEEEYIRKTFLI